MTEAFWNESMDFSPGATVQYARQQLAADADVPAGPGWYDSKMLPTIIPVFGLYPAPLLKEGASAQAAIIKQYRRDWPYKNFGVYLGDNVIDWSLLK
jgi:hypothetical protein